jgi:hypothetical protein
MWHHAATLTNNLLILTHPLECTILRIVHRALVIQNVKQTVQLFRERYTEDVMTVQQMTHIVDLSMCMEHIIHPV